MTGFCLGLSVLQAESHFHDSVSGVVNEMICVHNRSLFP